LGVAEGQALLGELPIHDVAEVPVELGTQRPAWVYTQAGESRDHDLSHILRQSDLGCPFHRAPAGPHQRSPGNPSPTTSTRPPSSIPQTPSPFLKTISIRASATDPQPGRRRNQQLLAPPPSHPDSPPFTQPYPSSHPSRRFHQSPAEFAGPLMPIPSLKNHLRWAGAARNIGPQHPVDSGRWFQELAAR